MHRIARVVLSIVVAIGFGVTVAGQAQAPAKPPATPPGVAAPMPANAVMMIYRCEVKPGHDQLQQKAAAATARVLAKLPGASPMLAMSAVAGPSEVWFMLPYESLAEMDTARTERAKAPAALQAEADQANDAEGLHYDRWGGILVMYLEDLSLDASFNVAPYRAMVVSTMRVKPGRTREFTDIAKKVMAAYKKADVGMRMAAFAVIAGAPDGTYLFMRPIKTAADLLPTDAARKAFRDAMGQEAMEQLQKAAADIIVSSEDTIFAFSPKMSHVPASYAASDPFWKVKATAETKKPAEPQKKPVEPVKK